MRASAILRMHVCVWYAPEVQKPPPIIPTAPPHTHTRTHTHTHICRLGGLRSVELLTYTPPRPALQVRGRVRGPVGSRRAPQHQPRTRRRLRQPCGRRAAGAHGRVPHAPCAAELLHRQPGGCGAAGQPVCGQGAAAGAGPGEERTGPPGGGGGGVAVHGRRRGGMRVRGKGGWLYAQAIWNGGTMASTRSGVRQAGTAS